MAKRNEFTRTGGTYRCQCCKGVTRNTGDGSFVRLCEECFELAGLDNQHNDDGTQPTTRELGVIHRMLAVIAERGGDVKRVKGCNSYLFRPRPTYRWLDGQWVQC
jgi:hypothetical protein